MSLFYNKYIKRKKLYNLITGNGYGGEVMMIGFRSRLEVVREPNP